MQYTVLFEIPEDILAGLQDGTYERLGGVIRGKETKRVVLWLKEALQEGDTETVLQNSPQVLKELQAMGLVGKIGLGVNLMTLGVVIVGFAYLGNKLSKIEKRLENIHQDIQEIKDVVDLLDVKMDMKHAQTLRTAIEIAERGQMRKGLDSLNDYNSARDKFKEMKNQFEGLIEILFRNELVIKHFDLFFSYLERYVIALTGEIRCSLLLNEGAVARKDIDQAVFKLDQIAKWFNSLVKLTNPDYIRVTASQNEKIVKLNKAFCESTERLESYTYQIDLLEEEKMTFTEWETLGRECVGNRPLVYLKAC